MPEVIMPKMGDAMEAGVLISWKVKDGDNVNVGDLIAEIETDKSNVEIEAEDAGVFRIGVAEGVTVPVGEVIATIGNGNSTPAPRPQASVAETAPKIETSTWKPAKLQSANPIPAPGVEPVRIKASPLAKRIARERGVDILKVSGTGPNGRIVESDILAFAAPPARRIPAMAEEPDLSPAASPEAQVIEPSTMRQVIARRMLESKTTIPHFYLTIEVDVEEISSLREKLNSYDASLPKITFNDMIVKATGKALAKFPEVNSVYRDGKILRRTGQHVGIAVALDDGLIVPVVRNASTLSLREISKCSRELVIRAREKKLQPGEYSDGSFTVSNLGSFDVENFIAIIDPSQGAILAVGVISKRAVVLDDNSIVARRRMNLSFSGDHRLMDGATGARFMQEVKRLIQNPLSLLE